MRSIRRRNPGTNRRRFSAFAAGVAAVLGIGVAAAQLPALASASNPTYTPQGGAWPTINGTGLYRVGMKMTVPKRHGLKVFQELLNEHGADLPVTGTYGSLTAAAVRDFQRVNRLPVTGSINLVTSRLLLGETIRREAASAGIPADLLCGHIMAESTMDPGAVGGTGTDLGVAQIVRRFVPELTEAQIWDEDAAIRYMAKRNAAAYRKYGRWDIAVTSYNSPLRALNWKRTGTPAPLAVSYSKKVMTRKCAPAKARRIGDARDERASRGGERTGASATPGESSRDVDAAAYCLVADGDARWQAFVRGYSAAEQPVGTKRAERGLLLPGYTVKLRPNGGVELAPTPMSAPKTSKSSGAPDALCV